MQDTRGLPALVGKMIVAAALAVEVTDNFNLKNQLRPTLPPRPRSCTAHKFHYIRRMHREEITLRNFKINLPAQRFALPVGVVTFFPSNKKQKKK